MGFFIPEDSKEDLIDLGGISSLWKNKEGQLIFVIVSFYKKEIQFISENKISIIKLPLYEDEKIVQIAEDEMVRIGYLSYSAEICDTLIQEAFQD